VFEKICPGEEFLPKAPNPEDIIYDDGEMAGETDTGFEPNADSETTMDCNIDTAGDSLQELNCAANVADRQEDLAASDSSPATTAVTGDDETQN